MRVRSEKGYGIGIERTFVIKMLCCEYNNKNIEKILPFEAFGFKIIIATI